MRQTPCFTVEGKTLEQCAKDQPTMEKCVDQYARYEQCREGLVRRKQGESMSTNPRRLIKSQSTHPPLYIFLLSPFSWTREVACVEIRRCDNIPIVRWLVKRTHAQRIFKHHPSLITCLHSRTAIICLTLLNKLCMIRPLKRVPDK